MSVAAQWAKKEWTRSCPPAPSRRSGTSSGRRSRRKPRSTKTRSGEMEGGGPGPLPVTYRRRRRTQRIGT
eukprot:6339620-Alexandrium_andersonii.AAC.1